MSGLLRVCGLITPTPPTPFTPMRLLCIPEAFDHPDFVFEPKIDGFRALAHIDVRRLPFARRRSRTPCVVRMRDSDGGCRISRCEFPEPVRTTILEPWVSCRIDD